eukprot:1952206-Prymnesium_polylepis.1
MTAMLRAAEGLGAKVNKTGGHHVHIDALDLNVDQIKKGERHAQSAALPEESGRGGRDEGTGGDGGPPA